MYTYFDDVDICLRAKRAGWETWYVVESEVVHLGGASTGITGKKATNRRPDYWFQARRRFFLKSYGKFYAALVDAAFILGYSLWRLRRRIQRRADSDPPQLLLDSIRHSVFCTGFRLKDVENPAMNSSANSAIGQNSPVRFRQSSDVQE